ncbi:MAG: DUF1566 domain-containing protein [Treponema sp.]|nr:DUF1566 domain-containing protein [Treponema sp.]
MDYSNNGQSDWFLPSRDELGQLYVNRTAVGNMGTSIYWSSSQFDGSNAYYYNFSPTGGQGTNQKLTLYSVRPVRAF